MEGAKHHFSGDPGDNRFNAEPRENHAKLAFLANNYNKHKNYSLVII